MIYFIGTNDYSSVKIGYTSCSPKSRMSGLQTGNANRLNVLWTMPGNQETEKLMQKYFSDSHVRGEWFGYKDRDYNKFMVIAELINEIDDSIDCEETKLEKINDIINILTKYNKLGVGYEKPKARIGFI